VDKAGLDKLFDLTGRVAIITGGTRGIGLATAKAFGAAGAKVVVASRKADACAAVEAELRTSGIEAVGIRTHMGDLDAIANLVDQSVDRFGSVDILMNNAANALAQPLGEFTPEAYAKSFDVNLRGPVFLTQAALPHLKASGHAAVINVISAGAFIPSAPVAMYSAAKAATMSFTRSLAAEFAPYGIRVNALAPGPTDTDMVASLGPGGDELLASVTMLKRVASPDEIAAPALFLASDASSYMTGQVLLIDGGMVPH
jgi:NAD(P)-dependent dehydrogenase (short-subunit alcohol dehydrogenase family)